MASTHRHHYWNPVSLLAAPGITIGVAPNITIFGLLSAMQRTGDAVAETGKAAGESPPLPQARHRASLLPDAEIGSGIERHQSGVTIARDAENEGESGIEHHYCGAGRR